MGIPPQSPYPVFYLYRTLKFSIHIPTPCIFSSDAYFLQFVMQAPPVRVSSMYSTVLSQYAMYENYITDRSTRIHHSPPYKTLNKSVPWYLSQRINRRVNARTLRSTATPLLIQPFARTDFAKRSFRCAAPSVWNSFPASDFGSDSLSVFKSRLKTFLFLESFN